MKKKHILILETGSPTFRSYILERLVAKGYRLTLFSHLPANWASEYVETIKYVQLNDQQSVLKLAKTIHHSDPIDGVLCWNEGATTIANMITHALGLPVISNCIAGSFRDKFLMRCSFEANGVPNPRFKIIRRKTDLDRIDWFPVVIKPCNLMGSNGVVKAKSKKELEQVYNIAVQANLEIVISDDHHTLKDIYGLDDSLLVESYLDGPEFSIEGYASNGSINIIGITEKFLVGEPWFDEAGHIFPAQVEQKIDDQITKTVKAAAKSLMLQNCIFHAELRVTKTGPVMIELAARAAGDFIPKLVEIATGADLVQLMVSLACGDPTKQISAPNCTAGVSFLSAKEPMYGKSARELDEIDVSESGLEIIDQAFYYNPEDVIPKPLTWGDTRIGHVIYKTNTYEKLKSKIKNR